MAFNHNIASNINAASISISGGLAANGSNGTSGQVLTSNGTGIYWGEGGSASEPIYIFETYISSNTEIAANQHGLSIGPVSFANGVSLTIASGQRWIVI